MLQHILCTDYKIVASLTTATSIFTSLRKHHEDLGTHTQVTLITKAFNTRFCPGMAMSHVIKEIDLLHTRILAISPLDSNHLCTVFLVNTLGEHRLQLKSMIQGSYDNPSFSSGFTPVDVRIPHDEATEGITLRGPKIYGKGPTVTYINFCRGRNTGLFVL